MLASKDEITKYIPQRFPIVMIHQLIEASNSHAVTQLLIQPENIFVWKGFFTEPGLVENIAQTAAVHVGFQCVQQNLPIPIGYIASIKNLIIHSLPKQEVTLTTSVKITNKVMDVTVAEGRVEADGVLLCSCEMRIFAKVNAKQEP